jgi:hypothetical protein
MMVTLLPKRVRNCRVCPDIKEDLIGYQHTCCSVVQFHLDGFRRYKTPIAHDQFGTARRIDLQVLRNLTLHHLALAPANRCHIDSDGTSHRAIAPAVTRELRDLRTRNLILARHAGDVGTGATNPLSLHDGSPSSRLRHMPTQKLAARPAAEDENFKLLKFWHALSPR